MNGPDYEKINPESALNDFLLRIDHYQESYETLDEEIENMYSFMKIFNTGKHYITPLS